MYENIFIYIVTCITISCIYTLFRNKFIYKISSAWVDISYDYYIYLLTHDIIKYNYYKNNNIDIYNTIYSYNKMMLYFWVWTPSKMVEDKKTCQEVISWKCGSKK